MPPSAGVTSELYMDKDNSGATLGAPPSAPAPAPPPTQPVRVTEPVVTKSRMADQTPDGRIRDTSTEAMLPKNDLGFRNLDDESMAKPAPEPTPAAEAAAPVEATPPPAPPVAAPEKVYAGKFKTPEDLEKSYQELERKLTQTSQEKAELSRRQSEAPPPPAAPKTPAQVAADEARKTEFLSKFVEDPEGVITDFQQKAVQQTQLALAAQQATHNWREANPDLVQAVEINGIRFSGEDVVAILAGKMAQMDPQVAADPQNLLTKATDTVRQFLGTIRTDAKKEALTQETRVIPLLSNTAQPTAPEQPSSKAPLTSDDAYTMHLRMLKEQEQKSRRGLRR